MRVRVHDINGDCHEVMNGDCGEVHDHIGVIVDIGPNANPQPADIVLLTHDDDDHIKGAAEYFRRTSGIGNSRLHPRELWVPYEWGVIGRELTYLIAMRVDLSEVEWPSLARNAFGELAELDAKEENEGQEWMPTPALDAIEGSHWPPEGYEDAPISPGETLPGLTELELDAVVDTYGVPRRSARTISERIIGSATRTAAVLQAALRSGWRIRYFNHCQGCDEPHVETEGRPGTITLIAAEERFIIPRPTSIQISTQNLAFAATLTIWNKRSLVSFAWTRCCFHPTRHLQCGMIFWADARGPERHHVPHFCASTAPHHGSGGSQHADAWATILNEHPAVVISTYNSSVRGPWPDFLNSFLPQDRACVRCWRNAGQARPMNLVVNVGCGTYIQDPCTC